MAGSKIKSWEVSDKFWERVRPLIPKPKRKEDKTYQRRRGTGRKPMDSRKVFCAIMFVLRTGIQWKALPKEFGSSSSVHAYFRKWVEAGFFLKLWKKGLAEYDEMEGIAWRWQSIDGSMGKAPLARESVGPNPTDRGKNGDQAARPRGRAWCPAVACRDGREPAGRDAGGGGSCGAGEEAARADHAEPVR